MTGGRLRVVMATARYDPYVGGVERHVARVSELLAAVGHEVTVLTTDPNGTLPPHAERAGVEVVRVPAYPRRGDLYVAPAVGRVLAERRFDVLHVQSYHTFVAPIAMRAARRAGLPYVVTFHGGGHSSRLRHALRGRQIRALGPLLRDAHRLVATASFEIELYGRLLGLPPEAFVLIPNGSDLPETGAERAASPDVVIASIGRLERYKGHRRAIAALPHVLEQIPEARLWIAGEGPDERHLRRLAQTCGVGDRVEIGAVPLADAGEFARRLAGVSLAVLLSEFETHPMAVLEAVAAGCPALVADTSGLGELAAAGYAQAIPLAAAPRDVAAAMVRLLEAPPERPRLVLPTWESCRDALAALYEEAACES